MSLTQVLLPLRKQSQIKAGFLPEHSAWVLSTWAERKSGGSSWHRQWVFYFIRRLSGSSNVRHCSGPGLWERGEAQWCLSFSPSLLSHYPPETEDPRISSATSALAAGQGQGLRVSLRAKSCLNPLQEFSMTISWCLGMWDSQRAVSSRGEAD